MWRRHHSSAVKTQSLQLMCRIWWMLSLSETAIVLQNWFHRSLVNPANLYAKIFHATTKDRIAGERVQNGQDYSCLWSLLWPGRMRWTQRLSYKRARTGEQTHAINTQKLSVFSYRAHASCANTFSCYNRRLWSSCHFDLETETWWGVLSRTQHPVLHIQVSINCNKAVETLVDYFFGVYYDDIADFLL